MKQTARRMKALSVVLVLAVLGAPAVLARPAGPTELGRIFFENPEIVGALEPSGKVVENHGLVKTHSVPAVVHLDNGQVLRFDANSSALLRGNARGEVEVRVLSGRVTKWSDRGRVLTAGQRSFFVLSPSFSDRMDAEANLMEAGRAPDRDRGSSVEGDRARSISR